ncbi:MAG: hypothetical protein KF746_11165 [Chitinophagaceae bacterium]|nr:hypothetical protein [Chitinophagaceae bacterium]
MHFCQVYKTNKEYIIVTKSQTKDWIWVTDEPILRVAVADSDSKLIEAILKALKSSRTNIPNISVEKKPLLEKETLKKMGQKSYTDLYKKSNSCSITRDKNGIITISPYKPYTPGKFSSLAVAEEGVVQVDMSVTDVSELEDILIEVLEHDYKKY